VSTRPVALHRRDEVRFTALPPLALYVHIPWCVRKCPYCDFNSHERRGELPEQEYVDALLADVEGLLPRVWGRRIGTVFIGGGTPSLFSPHSLSRLISEVRARLPLEPDCEITLEANPGTVEAERFLGFRDAGINRLSIGVQSFDDRALEALGRIHKADDARRAIDAALRAVGNVNVDLMYALPGQTLEAASRDVAVAVRAGVPHVSAYQLTIEKNTVFHAHPPSLPGHDLAADMQDAIEADLAGAGFEHYETSAFARPGHRCRHNLNYWSFGDYLGVGAGAHGKISFPDRVTRHERAKQPREYLRLARAGGSATEDRRVRAADLPFEFMLNALRLVEGFPEDLFPQRTGLLPTVVESRLAAAAGRGLVTRAAGHVRPTDRGRRFLNELLEMFLPEVEEPSP
jgi:oxygen-independent coproporphyrinogen-3 oxidase